jgi:LEA14-like dessication related protein
MIIIGCSKPKDIQYLDVGNFKMDEIGLGKSVISADLRFYNPNNFKMKMKDGSVDLSINNRFVGHSNLDTLLDIPKKDTFLIPLKMEVDMKSVLSNALNVLLSDGMDVKLDGNAKLGKAGIYFNVPIHYQGKQKLNLFNLN